MDLPLEYFYHNTVARFYIFYTYFITCLTFIITPLLVTAILTQSVIIGRLKGFLLNHVFWLFMMEVMLLVWKPVFLLPLAGGFQLGFFRGTSYKVTIFGLMSILMTIIFSAWGLAGTFIERYIGAFNGIFKTIWNSIYCKILYIFVYIVLFIIICVYTVILMNASQENMKSVALNMSTSLIIFVEEPTFIAFSENVHRFGDILIILAALAIIAGSGLLILIFSFYLYKNRSSKSLTSKVQRTLLAGCIAQMATSVIFLGVPTLFLFTALFFELPYSGVIMMFMMCLMSSEPFFDFLFCIYLVVPYRKFVAKILRKPFGLKNDTSLKIPSTVQIFYTRVS